MDIFHQFTKIDDECPSYSNMTSKQFTVYNSGNKNAKCCILKKVYVLRSHRVICQKLVTTPSFFALHHFILTVNSTYYISNERWVKWSTIAEFPVIRFFRKMCFNVKKIIFLYNFLHRSVVDCDSIIDCDIGVDFDAFVADFWQMTRRDLC